MLATLTCFHCNFCVMNPGTTSNQFWLQILSNGFRQLVVFSNLSGVLDNIFPLEIFRHSQGSDFLTYSFTLRYSFKYIPLRPFFATMSIPFFRIDKQEHPMFCEHSRFFFKVFLDHYVTYFYFLTQVCAYGFPSSGDPNGWKLQKKGKILCYSFDIHACNKQNIIFSIKVCVTSNYPRMMKENKKHIELHLYSFFFSYFLTCLASFYYVTHVQIRYF